MRRMARRVYSWLAVAGVAEAARLAAPKAVPIATLPCFVMLGAECDAAERGRGEGLGPARSRVVSAHCICCFTLSARPAHVQTPGSLGTPTRYSYLCYTTARTVDDLAMVQLHVKVRRPRASVSLVLFPNTESTSNRSTSAEVTAAAVPVQRKRRGFRQGCASGSGAHTQPAAEDRQAESRRGRAGAVRALKAA